MSEELTPQTTIVPTITGPQEPTVTDPIYTTPPGQDDPPTPTVTISLQPTFTGPMSPEDLPPTSPPEP